MWIQRVDRVAQVRSAPDGVTLLVASSKLTKSAKRWYEIQTGATVEFWSSLKAKMEKIFDKKIPFYKTMQKVEARKWSPQKETFDQYVIGKLALMYRLDLSEKDSIQLLTGGILQSLLQATALSVATNSLDVFLEKIRHITQGINEIEKEGTSQNGPSKSKETICRNYGKKGHYHKECRAECRPASIARKKDIEDLTAQHSKGRITGHHQQHRA